MEQTHIIINRLKKQQQIFAVVFMPFLLMLEREMLCINKPEKTSTKIKQRIANNLKIFETSTFRFTVNSFV